MHEDQVHVSIKLTSGKTLEKHVEHAVGSLDRPMSNLDLETKFRGQVEGILAKPGSERLIGLCWDIGRLTDAGEVARASVPGQKGGRRAAF